MKEERRRKGRSGKRLERKLNGLKVDFDKSVDLLVKDYDTDSHADLYYAIGTGG